MDRRNVPVALLMCDLVDSTRIVQQLGDAKAAAMFARHDEGARALLAEEGGREIDRTDGFLLLFPDVAGAVRFALGYHELLAELSSTYHTGIAARIGIHTGPVILRENPPEAVARGAKPLEVEGLAKPLTARLMSLAGGRQTLLSRRAADAMRSAEATRALVDAGLRWSACGLYRLKGIDEPVEVFAVGIPGRHRLEPPEASAKARPLGAGDAILGWRPAVGIEVPARPGWVLQRRLGEGGFGEVWLGTRDGEPAPRVFKFCFDAGRLRTLRREAALLALLREALGRRRDIAAVVGWNLEEPPFFLEMEYADGGDLGRWFEARGPEAIPLSVRVEIAASVAEALAAAHSVGVLHLDVKPSNVLVAEGEGGGPPRIMLADFGIGALADPGAVERLRLTVTELESGTSTSAGTLAYMAPELFEGESPSARSDIYALGVLTYQVVVGNLRRPMSPGWERLVGDELLREDIAAMVTANPAERIGDAGEVARRLRALEQRRENRRKEREAAEAARRAREELARMRRRRRILAGAAAALFVFAVSVGWQAWRAERARARAEREATRAREVSSFLEELFQVADPSGRQGATVTARELLDRGARRVQRELSGQPVTQARLEAILGRVYRRLGLLSRAEPLLVAAEHTLRLRLGAGTPERLDALRELGLLRVQQGRYPEARKALEEARRLAQSPGQERPALEGLARLYQAWGKLEAAHDVRKRLSELETRPAAHRSAPGERARPPARRERWRPLRLVAAIPFPGQVTTAAVFDPSRGLLLLAGPRSVVRLDERGVSPPTELGLAPDETPLRAFGDGRLLVRKGDTLLFRLYDPVSDAQLDRTTGIRLSAGAEVVTSPDGAWIGAVTGDGVTVYRGAAEGFRRIANITLGLGPGGKLVAVDGGLVAAASAAAGRLVVKDVRSGRVLLDRRADWTGRAQALALEPQGGWVAVGGWFDDVLVYRLNERGGPERFTLPGSTYGLELFPDYPSLVVAKDGLLALWRRGRGVVAVHEEAGSRIFLAGWAGSSILAVDHAGRRVLHFAAPSLRVKESVVVATKEVWSAAFDSEGRCLFTGGADGRLARYDPRSGRLRVVQAHTQGLTALRVLGPHLVTASDDRTVAVWRKDSLALLRRREAHGFLVNALDWDPAGVLWTSSSDHTIRSWSLPTLKPRERVPVGCSAAALWLRSEKGLGVVGCWDGSWSELRLGPEGWHVAARHRWESEGLYAIVDIEESGLLLLVGNYPGRLLLFDPRQRSAARLPLGPAGAWWAAAAPGGAVVFGDGVMGRLSIQRTGPSTVRVRARWAAVASQQFCTGTVAPPLRLAAGGTGDGRLILVSLPALESLPPATDAELRLAPLG